MEVRHFSLEQWPLKKGPIPGLKKVGKEQPMTERDISEERSSQLHRLESLKTCICTSAVFWVDKAGGRVWLITLHTGAVFELVTSEIREAYLCYN